MRAGHAIAIAAGAALAVGLHVGISRAADAAEERGTSRATVAWTLIGIGVVGTFVAARYA